MITILQVDRNYKQNSNYNLLSRNLEKMSRNGNNYRLHVDNDEFIKDRGESYTELKIIKLLEILKTYNDNEIIMYIDAFDTSVEATDKEIEEKFLALDIDVLYSGERCCWPNEGFRKYFTEEYFLNSGTIIFKNIKFQKILEVLSLVHQRSNSCDQYYHTIFATIRLMDDVKIALDESNNIFQCLWGYDENEFERVNDRVKNKVKNSFPCVLHGNGSGKETLKKLIFSNQKPRVAFLGFVEDKMGINFMNQNFEKIQVYAEIKNTFNQVVFSDNLELSYNASYFIHTGIKDNYTFTIYDVNNQILLQERNY